MEKIIALFNFENSSWLVLAERFGLTFVLMLVLFFLTAFILISVRKKKNSNEVPFPISFMHCFLWSIVVVVFLLAIDVFFLVRGNGGYFFSVDALSWTFYCGWIDLFPEFFNLIIWVVLFLLISSRMKKITKF